MCHWLEVVMGQMEGEIPSWGACIRGQRAFPGKHCSVEEGDQEGVVTKAGGCLGNSESGPRSCKVKQRGEV